MKKPKILIALCCLAMAMATGTPAQQTYNEDFTTDTFRHWSSTADWNTAEEKLKLFPFTPSIQGSVIPTGACRGITIRGNIAYVASGNSGLQVVDITDLESPVWIGNESTAGYSYQVDVAGDYAYVADWDYGLVVMDISDPANPATVATLPTTGSSLGIDVAGQYAYIGNGSGLMIVDISDPLNPSEVGSLATAGAAARGLTIAGHFAYVPDGDAGLQIIDIAEAANPTLVSTFDTPGYAYSVKTAGIHAYISDQNNGLVILDISDPANPVQVGNYTTSGPAPRSLFYSGQFVYLASNLAGLEVIDVTDPAVPVFANQITTNGYAYDVFIHGNHALVADLNSGLTTIKLAENTPLVKVKTINTSGPGHSLAAAGDHLFLTGGSGNITVYDITSPENPVFAGNANIFAHSLVVFGNYLLGFNSSGLQVIDISQPETPVGVATLGGFGNGDRAVVWGTRAIVVDNMELVVVDLSNPLQPVAGNPVTLGLGTIEAHASGNYAYVAHQYNGFVVVDISDPVNPLEVGSYDIPLVQSLAISGNHAYVGTSGILVILDITNPLSPTEVGTYATASHINEVHIVGDRAYLRSGVRGLEVLDISNPQLPVPLAEDVHGISNWRSVAIHGDFTYSSRNPAGGLPGDNQLLVYQTSQRAHDTENNLGASGNVAQGDKTIIQANFNDLFSGNDIEKYELSADGGTNWQEILEYTSFVQFANPGTDLRWRVTFGWGPEASEIDNLNLDWFGPAGPLASIADVPDDQGGRVIVDVKRSAYDYSGETIQPVTQYGVYRRLAVMAKAIDFEKSGKSDHPKEVAGLFPGYPSAWLDGKFFVSGSGDKSGFPEGTWVLVATIPALQSDHYFAEISTAADSSAAGANNADFVVTTHTTSPSIWYTSNIMSGYSVDNIAPGIPSTITAQYQADGVELEWDDSPDSDFQFFRVYRGNQPGFVPTEENLLAETGLSNWSDSTSGPWDYFYQVSAVDHAGNESQAAGVDEVSDVPDVAARTVFALGHAVPNPFNPLTTIEYSLPASARVQLKIYDMAGHEVLTLVDDVQEAGVHKAQWLGRDNRGQQVASGIYLYRLRAGRNEEWKRMTLLK